MNLKLDSVEVVNNEAASRFEAHIGELTATLTYRRVEDTIILEHTEVPPVLQGRGIAGKLAQTALEYARSAHLHVVPRCPAAASYMNRHPEYKALYPPDVIKWLTGEKLGVELREG
jgi:uncharacterized protein